MADRHLLNKTLLCRALSVSTQAFDAWGVEPVLREGRCAYFLVADVLANRLEHQRQSLEAQHAPAGGQKDELDLEMLAERIETQKLKNAGLRQRLGPISIINDLLAKCASSINAILDSLALTMKRKIPRLTAKEVEIVRAEVAKAQNAIADVEVDVEQAVSRYYERAA